MSAKKFCTSLVLTNGIVTSNPGFDFIDSDDVPTFVGSGASHAPGAVPDPPASSGTTKFLREDATWAVPPGSGTVTSVDLDGGTTGLTFSGGPITTSGTITIGGLLDVANGGTGVDLSATGPGIAIQDASGNPLSIFQASGTGETSGFTAGSGTAVKDDSTFTGNVGSTAYRISDIVKALKGAKLLAD